MGEEEAAEVADEQPPTPEDIVGYPDGTVLPDGEKIVYEYDADGTFAGWHKEVVA
jgi:hypothetical protein